mgnify:CR=1 FL=1
MLVSTTIVEVGVDIPSSDIMVIATPERFGLATLHQLRGRVGRSNRLAFAYFIYRSKVLSDEAYKRLTSIMENTELGSGTEQQTLGVCEQRTEVRHGTYTHENQGWKDCPFI